MDILHKKIPDFIQLLTLHFQKGFFFLIFLVS